MSYELKSEFIYITKKGPPDHTRMWGNHAMPCHAPGKNDGCGGQGDTRSQICVTLRVEGVRVSVCLVIPSPLSRMVNISRRVWCATRWIGPKAKYQK